MSAYKRRKLVKKIREDFNFGFNVMINTCGLMRSGFGDFQVSDIDKFVLDALFKYHLDEINKLLGKEKKR